MNKVKYIYNNHYQAPNIDNVVNDIANTKQSKITNTVQSSQPTDNDYVGGFTADNPTINPISFNSWIFSDIWNWVKTKLGVRIDNTDSNIGSGIIPTYCDSNGKITASTSSVGNSSKPLYLNNGTFTEVQDNTTIVDLGSTSSANTYSSNPSIGVSGKLDVSHGGTGVTTLSSGALLIGNGTNAIATSSSKGNSTIPIYINSSGKPTACSGSVINYSNQIADYSISTSNISANTNYTIVSSINLPNFFRVDVSTSQASSSVSYSLYVHVGTSWLSPSYSIVSNSTNNHTSYGYLSQTNLTFTLTIQGIGIIQGAHTIYVKIYCTN